MNKKLMWVVTGAAFLGMGVAMPSCPGQQAMQQQIDTMQAKETESLRKIQALEGQVKNLSDGMKQIQQVLTQFSQVVVSHKTAIEEVTKQVEALNASKSKGASAKTAPKKKK